MALARERMVPERTPLASVSSLDKVCAFCDDQINGEAESWRAKRRNQKLLFGFETRNKTLTFFSVSPTQRLSVKNSFTFLQSHPGSGRRRRRSGCRGRRFWPPRRHEVAGSPGVG